MGPLGISEENLAFISVPLAKGESNGKKNVFLNKVVKKKTLQFVKQTNR